jgi:hypothetical protein
MPTEHHPWAPRTEREGGLIRPSAAPFTPVPRCRAATRRDPPRGTKPTAPARLRLQASSPSRSSRGQHVCLSSMSIPQPSFQIYFLSPSLSPRRGSNDRDTMAGGQADGGGGSRGTAHLADGGGMRGSGHPPPAP